MVYLGKGESAIAILSHPQTRSHITIKQLPFLVIWCIWGRGDRTLGIEEVRSRGSPGICRGGREPFNFEVCDNFSTKPALTQNGGGF